MATLEIQQAYERSLKSIAAGFESALAEKESELLLQKELYRQSTIELKNLNDRYKDSVQEVAELKGQIEWKPHFDKEKEREIESLRKCLNESYERINRMEAELYAFLPIKEPKEKSFHNTDSGLVTPSEASTSVTFTHKCTAPLDSAEEEVTDEEEMEKSQGESVPDSSTKKSEGDDWSHVQREGDNKLEAVLKENQYLKELLRAKQESKDGAK